MCIKTKQEKKQVKTNQTCLFLLALPCRQGEHWKQNLCKVFTSKCFFFSLVSLPHNLSHLLPFANYNVCWLSIRYCFNTAMCSAKHSLPVQLSMFER